MFEELIEAIQNNHTAKAKKMIQRMSAEDFNETDSDGRNAFHHATIEHNIELVKILYAKCDEPELRIADNFGNTALNYATESNDNNLINLVFYGPYHSSCNKLHSYITDHHEPDLIGSVHYEGFHPYNTNSDY
jgi:ankyrin repeat protein